MMQKIFTAKRSGNMQGFYFVCKQCQVNCCQNLSVTWKTGNIVVTAEDFGFPYINSY